MSKPYTGKTYKQVGHPTARNRHGKKLTVLEHRYLAAKALGRPLPNGVEVHHVDGGQNGGVLVICQDHAYHMLLHMRQRALEACGHADCRKCRFCKQYDDQANLYVDPKRSWVFEHRVCSRAYYAPYVAKRVNGQ